MQGKNQSKAQRNYEQGILAIKQTRELVQCSGVDRSTKIDSNVRDHEYFVFFTWGDVAKAEFPFS